MTTIDAPTAQSSESSQSVGPADRKHPVRSWVNFTITMAVVVASTVATFMPLKDEAIGVAATCLMLCLIFLRVPIAIAMLVPALLGMYALRDERLVESTLGTLAYHETASWTLSVVPMFVFMGLLLWKAGITESLYLAANKWLGWMPGGLAVGTNLAGSGLASVSGSTVATTYALARIGIPEMLRSGISPRLAVGSVMVAGLPGQLIPPSIMLVLYAGIAEVAVGPQLLAGILPGLLVSVLFSVMIIIYAKFVPRFSYSAGQPVKGPTVTWGERFSSLVHVWPVPLIMFVIMYGMFSGIFTATEAGAIAALMSVVVTMLWKRKGGAWRAVSESAVGTASATGAIFFILVGVAALSRMYTLSGVDRWFAEMIVDLDMSRVQFLLVMVAVYLLLGMVMEPLPMMVLTVPVLAPTLASLDISMLWFGIFVVFMGELAILSPPVGILTFIIGSIVKHPEVNLGHPIDTKDINVALLAFTPMALIVVLVLIFFPELVTLVPDLASSGP